MRKYILLGTFTLILALTTTSCVDRKTENKEGTVRLDAPEDNSADTEFTDAITDGTGNEGDTKEMSNEDLVEVAEAKSTINDYYDAFTRKAPREAFDMWDHSNTSTTFSTFSEEHPNYEKITVAFKEEDTQVKQVDSVYTATIPLRMSATDADGNIINYSGVAQLKKDAKEKNSKYKIESMDMKKEDS